MKAAILTLNFIILPMIIHAQSTEYTQKKQKALASDSPFTKIINRELPATIAYEDDDIIAFVPLRKQAPVHLLIVPKKPIPSINNIDESDQMLMGKMFLVAKLLADREGIAETGYRLSLNNNEHAGQSVFHIHMHLLGGKFLGPMVTQDYKDDRKSGND